jgi:DNA polymerase-1
MTLVFIDANNLGYRAYHTTGTLSHDADLTGVAFGFLNQIFTFLKNAPHGIEPVFCWDSPSSLRKTIYPDYKKRGDQTEEAAAKRLELYAQFDVIREEIIPAMGWTDRCWQKEGYEADDLISWGCRESREKSIIVSGDEDLYQCLYHCDDAPVTIYKPGKNIFYSEFDLISDYRVNSTRWAEVKSIAGCKSDNIPGVSGVGEKTAIKYLHGELREGKKKDSIRQFIKSDAYTRNLTLVSLPYFQLGYDGWNPQIKKGELYKANFYDVFKKYGMDSFIRRLDEFSNILELL